MNTRMVFPDEIRGRARRCGRFVTFSRTVREKAWWHRTRRTEDASTGMCSGRQLHSALLGSRSPGLNAEHRGTFHFALTLEVGSYARKPPSRSPACLGVRTNSAADA